MQIKLIHFSLNIAHVELSNTYSRYMRMQHFSVACEYSVSWCCLAPKEQYLTWARTFFICNCHLKTITSLISRSEQAQKCPHIISSLHAHMQCVNDAKLRVSKFQHKLKQILLYLYLPLSSYQGLNWSFQPFTNVPP
jgi:hypothetical protein